MKAVKRRANAVLAAAAVLFVIALILKIQYPGNDLVNALLTVTEASLAGGVADWFAVTALFRRPLGFPYHTALIPRNRERVTRALAHAVEQDFLSKQAIKDRLSQANLLKKFIAYSQAISLRPLIRTFIEKTIIELVETIDPHTVGRLGERVCKIILKRQSLVPHVAAGISWALRQGKDKEIYYLLVDKLADWVGRPQTRDAIWGYLEHIEKDSANKSWLVALVTGFMEMTDGINLDDAADALHQELINSVAELRNEQHPVQLWFRDELGGIVAKLETPEWTNAVENWKDGLLSRLEMAEPLAALTETVLLACKQPTIYRDYAVDWLTVQAASYWRQFKENSLLQSQAEDYIKMLVLKVVDREHALIGEIASRALNKLSDEALNRFIEDKAGEDLDWIRINGVIIGGLVGAGLAAARFF
ncbi:DUF445 domain-containing protein [Sporomusa acidovorans]|uniref:DUF445 domain-containing protein n=1 Tax=Sporomusa acidovorans (strain ATCC 49682 / DSM 3132 / Mol) TaxID=1123286 RepID=A0ABZ3JAU7_SPOA4|nr:DUF445 domain-containing protein [Sporomusa acidovorans]OZC21655.1 hypothetical protein SPACI_17290 [Sporomusa acidovorans DSM 3132]SDD60876.1 Uncharacterized membrane-anchored protein YjiN, DUF445 family [Sporomusa acidovorans]